MRNLLGIIAVLGTACTGTLDMGGGDDTAPPATDVRVLVKDGSVAQPGVRVIFQNADDSVIAELVTEGTGTATTTMAAGNVTVIRTFPPPAIPADPQRPPELYTYVGVKAGDLLELGDAVSETATAAAINVMVPPTAVGNVNVMTPCGTGSGQAPLIPITVRGCDPSLVLYVTDGDQSSFVATAPYGENVDVSSNSFLGSLGSTISAVNVQPNSAIAVEKRLVMGNYTIFSTGQKRVETTPADVNIPDLTGVDQLQLVTLTDPMNRTQVVATRSPYTKGTTTVDGTILGIIPYVQTPNYSPTGISWVEAGPAAGAADSVVTTLTITRNTGGAPPGPDDVYIHAIVAPHTGMTMQMPTMPASAANYNPSAADRIDAQFGLVQVGGGYDQLRNLAFRGSSILDNTGPGGQIVLSYFGGTPPRI